MTPSRTQLIAELRRLYAIGSPTLRAALQEVKDNPPRNPIDEAVAQWWADLQSATTTDADKVLAMRQLFSHVRE